MTHPAVCRIESKLLRLAAVFAISSVLSACIMGKELEEEVLRDICPDPGVTSVTAAPDGRYFIISYCDPSRSFVGIGDIENGAVKIIAAAPERTAYTRPVLSLDGKKIFFIVRRTMDKSSIASVNADGFGLTILTTDTPDTNNIIDITLSPDGGELYYINSRSYRKYSSLGRAAPHEKDIYALTLAEMRQRRLSFDLKYSLNGLAPSRDGTEIVTRSAVLKLQEYAHLYPVGYAVPESFNFSAGDLTYSSQYPLSRISPLGEFVLASGKTSRFEQEHGSNTSNLKGFGLYLVRVRGMEVLREILYLPSSIDSPALMEGDNTVLFIRSDKAFGGGAGRELWSVHIDGSALKRVDLDFAEGDT